MVRKVMFAFGLLAVLGFGFGISSSQASNSLAPPDTAAAVYQTDQAVVTQYAPDAEIAVNSENAGINQVANDSLAASKNLPAVAALLKSLVDPDKPAVDNNGAQFKITEVVSTARLVYAGAASIALS